MANFVERKVIEPQAWLARIDFANRSAPQVPFIEIATFEAKSIISGFRKNYPIEIKPPVGMMRLAGRVSIATALGLLMGLAFGPIRDTIFPDGFKEGLSYEGTITLELVTTLPVRLSDDWIIDSTWIQNNCGDGHSKGTGIPDMTSTATKLSQDSLVSSLFSPEEILDMRNKENKANRDLADKFCQVFGNSNQTAP